MENVIIIGGGPAGLSAAIYLARAGLKPLVFAGSPPGGQLMLTSEVENYPGYESILGAELIEKIRGQAKKFGTKILDQNISKADFTRSPFKIIPEGGKWKVGVETSQENGNKKFEKNPSSINQLPNPSPNLTSNLLLSKSVIIATGAKAIWLGLESETRLRGKGVSACATCDAFFFREKTVAVVGGGDTALEEALTLTKFAKKVYLVHRRDSFRASKIMQKRVKANPKIEIIFNAVVEEIVGNKKVEGIKIRNPKSEIRNNSQNSNLENSNLFRASSFELRNLPLEGVFVAIGHKPDTEMFRGKIVLDDKGYIITSERAALDNFKFQILNYKSQTNPKYQIQSSKRLEFRNSDLFGAWDLEFGAYRNSTSVPGVFAAGDCVDHKYRQAAVAAGMGVSAALEVEKYLENC